jgi:hypothetical protein
MPNSSHTILVVIGGVLLVIGLLGGGIEISDIRLPRMASWLRAITVMAGLFFMGLGLYLDPQVRCTFFPDSCAVVAAPPGEPAVGATPTRVVPTTPAPTQTPPPLPVPTATPSSSEVPNTSEEAAQKWGGSPAWWRNIAATGWKLEAQHTVTIGPDWRIDFVAPDGRISSCDSTQAPGVYGPATVDVTVATLWYVPGETKCPPSTTWGKANP